MQLRQGRSLEPLTSPSPLDELLPEGDHWTRESLRGSLERRYSNVKARELAMDESAGFAFPATAGMPSPTYASCRWRKQWFTDDVPAIDLLTDYPGPIAYHFGEIDSQNPVALQLQMLTERLRAFRIRPTYAVHRGRGHTLRTDHPLLGPLDEEATDRLVKEALAMLV